MLHWLVLSFFLSILVRLACRFIAEARVYWFNEDSPVHPVWILALQFFYAASTVVCLVLGTLILLVSLWMTLKDIGIL